MGFGTSAELEASLMFLFFSNLFLLSLYLD